MNQARLLNQRLRLKPPREGGWLPDDAYVDDCLNRWLGDGRGLCRFPRECKAKVPRDPRTCVGYRCDATYWRAHNDDVGRIMKLIAPFVGGDPEQYRLVGRLHDVDYLEAPHDVDRGAIEDDVHPGLVVLDMEARGAPVEMLLAILEHAPRARLPDVKMGPMSQALYFADNFATCKSAGCPLGEEPYPRPPSMPSDLWDALMKLDITPIDDTETAKSSRWNTAVQAIEEVLLRK